MKKYLLLIPLLILAILTVTVLLPSALVVLWPSGGQADGLSIVQLNTGEDLQIDVYLHDSKQIVKMPLEKYVRGVVAAEMPVKFEMEALKAQAIAARTYVARRLAKGTKTPEGADVTDDHNDGQAYLTDEQLQKNWGLLDYPKNLSKINEAVNQTRAQILLYQGDPIEALFFSTSSGMTENSEDYWGKAVPYLRSVKSPWDEQSEKFQSTTEIKLSELTQKLGITSVMTAANANGLIQTLEKTATDHIKKIRVGDKTFSGADFRTLLGLRSTWFTWQVTGDKITFVTHGYGHGVGLSQYGANGMAQEGKKAAEIVTYYYQGVEIGDVKTVLKTAKK